MPTPRSRGVAPAVAWLAAAGIAFVLLPWYALPDNFAWSKDLAALFTQQDAATGILEALRFGRWWLLGPLVGLAIAAAELPLHIESSP